MLYILVFIFGAIIGSFLNVVIFRYNTGETILNARSRCFSCGKKLRWYELIPVFSFIIQRGKCRGCGSKISIQYPIVEILTGIMFLLITWELDSQVNLGIQFPSLGYYFIIFSLLIIIAVYDIHHKIIPNLFVYSFIILSFLNLFQISNFEIQNFDTLGFLIGISFFTFFGLFWLVSNGRWMGLGDAKLMLGIGWLLGAYKGLVAILLSFWIGALVGLALIFFRKSFSLKSQIPFGPFLVLGAAIAFFWGDRIASLII